MNEEIITAIHKAGDEKGAIICYHNKETEVYKVVREIEEGYGSIRRIQNLFDSNRKPTGRVKIVLAPESQAKAAIDGITEMLEKKYEGVSERLKLLEEKYIKEISDQMGNVFSEMEEMSVKDMFETLR